MDKDVKVYPLKYPVKLGELACTEVKLGRPKTKDFVAVGNRQLDTAGAVVSLISSISGVPEAVVNLFDIDDISVLRIEAMRIFESYFTTNPYEANPTAPPEETAAGNG